MKLQTIKRMKAYRDTLPEGSAHRLHWDLHVAFAEAVRNAPKLTADQDGSLQRIFEEGGSMPLAEVTHCFRRDVTLMLRKGAWLELATPLRTYVCLTDMARWLLEDCQRVVDDLEGWDGP
jgi:hypothetical protein